MIGYDARGLSYRTESVRRTGKARKNILKEIVETIRPCDRPAHQFVGEEKPSILRLPGSDGRFPGGTHKRLDGSS